MSDVYWRQVAFCMSAAFFVWAFLVLIIPREKLVRYWHSLLENFGFSSSDTLAHNEVPKKAEIISRQSAGIAAHIKKSLEDGGGVVNKGERSHEVPQINITSHNQSGGITAHTVNVRHRQRNLDAALKSKILAELPKDKLITITAMINDTESCVFADQLYDFLKMEGFNVSNLMGYVQAIPVPRGVVLRRCQDKIELIVGSNPP